MGDDVYRHWRAKLEGKSAAFLATMYPANELGVVSIENPQPGLWLTSRGGGYINGVKQDRTYLPLQIWLEDENGDKSHSWGEGLVVRGLIGQDVVEADAVARAWMFGKDDRSTDWTGPKAITTQERDHWLNNDHMWPWDPPPPVQTQPETMEFEVAAIAVRTETVAPLARGSQPGDNSGDLSGYRGLRERIKGEIAEAINFFTRNPIKTKSDADKCENWRKRIWQLGLDAEAARKDEKAPHQEIVKEIDGRWMPLVQEAKEAAKVLEQTADTWVKAEQKRLRDEAEKKAREEFLAEQKRRAEEHKRIQEERKRAEEERAKMEADNPIAALTGSLPDVPELPPEPESVEAFVPIIEAPKIMIGTTGNRRSAKEGPATATIVNLEAAARFYARQQNPDLVKLIQKLADKAAKAGAAVDGIRMSFQHEAAE